MPKSDFRLLLLDVGLHQVGHFPLRLIIALRL